MQYINKEITGLGYHVPRRTIAVCDNYFCAEVCETGIIYRTHLGHYLLQPPLRQFPENEYSSQYPSYGHVSPCGLELTIDSLETNSNGFYTDSSDTIGAYSGFLYGAENKIYVPFYGYTEFTENTRTNDKAWRIPLCRDTVFSKTGLIYAKAYLDFDNNDGFSYTNNDKRNIYLYCDFFNNLHSEDASPESYKTITVRKLVGNITYYSNDNNTTHYTHLVSGYYNSSVYCTGWKDESFDEVIFNQNVYNVAPSSIKFSSINLPINKINNTDVITFSGPPTCRPDNDMYGSLNIEYIQEPSGYISYFSVPYKIDLSLNMSGVYSHQVSGIHTLSIPINKYPLNHFGFSNVGYDELSQHNNDGYLINSYSTNNEPLKFSDLLIKNRKFNLYLKEFNEFDYAPSGYNIPDIQHHHYPTEPYINSLYQSISTAPVINTNISAITCLFDSVVSGCVLVALVRSSGSINTIDHFGTPGYTYQYGNLDGYNDNYNSVIVRNTIDSSDSNILSIYSGNIYPWDLNGGLILNKDIHLKQTYVHPYVGAFEPYLYISGSTISLLEGTSTTFHNGQQFGISNYGCINDVKHPRDNTYSNPNTQSGATNTTRVCCRQGENPNGWLVDMSALELYNGYIHGDIGNQSTLLGYHAILADQNCINITNRYKISFTPFQYQHCLSGPLLDATPLYSNCSGCNPYYCIINHPDNQKPNGTYFLQKGKRSDLLQTCATPTCDFDYDCYFYKNPDFNTLCDWNMLLLSMKRSDEINDPSGIIFKLDLIYGNEPNQTVPDTGICGILNGPSITCGYTALTFTKRVSMDGIKQLSTNLADYSLHIPYTKECVNSHTLSFETQPIDRSVYEYSSDWALLNSMHVSGSSFTGGDASFSAPFNCFNNPTGIQNYTPNNGGWYFDRMLFENNNDIRQYPHPIYSGGLPIITPVFN